MRKHCSMPSRRLTGLSPAALALVLVAGAAVAANPSHATNYCSMTADSALTACGHEVEDDFWIAAGNCINIANAGDRGKCEDAADEDRADGHALCAAQFDARTALCAAVGEDRYDPKFNPAKFVDPLEIGVSVEPNPYLPLNQGRQWVYEGGGETVTVTVTPRTKLIGGVTCVVVNDVVEEDGEVVEDTDDWVAQDKLGNVWYCGEIARDFETFDGDAPAVPELVDIGGSWKAFRDHAKPGVLMPAAPQVGTVYRQEFALGDAEDAAEVLSVTGSAATPAGFCDGDCVITKEFTPLEPGVFELKHFAPGIGLILEVDPETGERVELVDVNF